MNPGESNVRIYTQQVTCCNNCPEKGVWVNYPKGQKNPHICKAIARLLADKTGVQSFEQLTTEQKEQSLIGPNLSFDNACPLPVK